MQNLVIALLFTACSAQLVVDDEGYSTGNYFDMPMTFLGGDYIQTRGAVATCPSDYQFITDEDACLELAKIIPGKVMGERYTDTNINSMPMYCTTREVGDINYRYNPKGTSTDILTGLLCIKSSKVCDEPNGTMASSSYPCVCGSDVCATGEICNLANNVCEVMVGYYETERTVSECPAAYQPILDDQACKQIAQKFAPDDKTWGHVLSYGTVPYGCSTWTTDIVNYYVNPSHSEPLHQDIDASLLCIRKSMVCDVTNGSDVSSSYPCVCGTDTCAENEVCDASKNMCEIIKGYYETERLVSTCPAGYSTIYDAAACEQITGNMASMIPHRGSIPQKAWGHTYRDGTVPHGCGTRLADTVNYYVNDYVNGMVSSASNTDVKNSLLCISDTMECSVKDGSTKSSTYPCLCGTDTCSQDEICNAANSKCEVIAGVYETDRMANFCPDGYKQVTNFDECKELATKIPQKTWMVFPLYSGTAYGCGTWKSHTINFFEYSSTPNTEANMALLCIKDTEFVSTLSTAPLTAGDTIIPVADTTGLRSGMSLTISDGTNSETANIVSVSTDRRLSEEERRLATGMVTIDTPLKYSYAAGATVTAKALPKVMSNATNATGGMASWSADSMVNGSEMMNDTMVM